MQSSKLFAALIVTIFCNITFSLEQQLTTYSERVKNVYPRNVYQIRETLFDKLDSFGIKYTSEQKTQKFSNIRLWIILCPKGNLQRHKYNNLDRETRPGIWINIFKPCERINFPLQLWLSSPRCIFQWNSWKFSFPKQSENENLFLDIKTTIKIKLRNILE